MAQFTINKSALSAVEGQLKASRSDIVSSLTHIINVANSCAAINIFAPPIYLAGVQEDDEPIKDYREDGRKYIKYAKNIVSNARDLSNIKNDLTAVINDVENILNAIDDFESQSMSLNGVTQRANSSLGVMVLGSGLGSTSVAEEVGVAITDLVTDESGLLNLDSSLEKGDDSGTFNVIGRLLGDTSLEDINGNLASEFVSSLPELEDTLDAGGVGSLLTGGASLFGIDNSDGDAREGVLSSMITLAGGLLAPVGEGIEEITSEVTEVVNSVGNKNPDDAAEDKTKTKNAVGVLRNFNRPAQAGDNNGAADQRVVDEPVITEEEPEVVLNNSMVEDSPQESQLEETPQQEESQPNEGLDRASAGLTQNMANHRSSNNSRDDNQGQGEGVPLLEESIPEEAPVEEQHSAPQENNNNPEPANTNAKENNNSNNSNNNPENVLDRAQKVTPGDNSNGNKNVLDNVNNVTNDKDGSKVAGAGVAAMTAGVGSVIGKNVDIPVNPVTPSIGDIPSVSNVDVPNATPATVSNNETATEFINNLNDVSGNNTGNPVYDNNKFADNFEQNNQNIVDNNTINNVNNINDINSLNNQNDINSQNNLNTQNNNVNNGQQNNNVTNRVNNSSNDAKRDVSNDFGKSKKIYSDGETQGTENNPSTEQELKNDNGSDKVDELQEKGIKEKKELEQGEGVISGSSGYIKEPSKTEFIVATGSTVGSVIVAAILKVLEFINFFAFILLIIAIILLFTTYCSFRKKRVKTYKHQMNKMNRNSTNNNGVNSLNTKNSNNSINNGLQPLTGNGVVSNQVVNNQKTNNTMMNSQNMNSSNTNMNNQQSMGVNQVNNMQSTTREMVNKNEFGSGNGGLQNNNINMQSNRTNENSKSDLIIPPMKDSPNYEEFGTGLDFVNNSSNK